MPLRRRLARLEENLKGRAAARRPFVYGIADVRHEDDLVRVHGRDAPGQPAKPGEEPERMTKAAFAERYPGALLFQIVNEPQPPPASN